jgi:hypothetical protein
MMVSRSVASTSVSHQARPRRPKSFITRQTSKSSPPGTIEGVQSVSRIRYSGRLIPGASGKQFGAGRGELQIGPGFVPHHPPFVDRPLDTAAKLLARAAGMSEIAI